MRTTTTPESTVALFTELNPLNQLNPPANTLIIGAHSPETAVAVTDYPYGRLRCIMRYWLEFKRNHGVRLMSQTNNPKKPGLVWNKPHGSTYRMGAVVLRTNEEGHVKDISFTMWQLGGKTAGECDALLAKLKDFEQKYSAAFTANDTGFMRMARSATANRIIELVTPHDKAPERSYCKVCKNYSSDCTGVAPTPEYQQFISDVASVDCDCRAAEFNAPYHSETCALRVARESRASGVAITPADSLGGESAVEHDALTR